MFLICSTNIIDLLSQLSLPSTENGMICATFNVQKREREKRTVMMKLTSAGGNIIIACAVTCSDCRVVICSESRDVYVCPYDGVQDTR